MVRRAWVAEDNFGKNEVQLFIKKLYFNISKVGVGHLHKPFSPKGGPLFSRALIVRTTHHLCLFELHTFHPLLVRSLQQARSLLHFLYVVERTYFLSKFFLLTPFRYRNSQKTSFLPSSFFILVHCLPPQI